MTHHVCPNCGCADCKAEEQRVDPLYEGLMAVLTRAGLWEGDAHALAEQVVSLAEWLQSPHAGSRPHRGSSASSEPFDLEPPEYDHMATR